MAGINSGILYLENFVDSVNNLPADVQRTLGYIQTLDKRFNGASVKWCCLPLQPPAGLPGSG